MLNMKGNEELLEGVREEYWFAKEELGRNWRFDFAWPEHMVAVEIEGVSYRGKGTRHQRGAGFEDDCEKYNEAAVLGWYVLRFTKKQVDNGYAIQTLSRLRGELEGYHL